MLPEVADIDLDDLDKPITNPVLLTDSRSISFFTPVEDTAPTVKASCNLFMSTHAQEHPPLDMGTDAL